MRFVKVLLFGGRLKQPGGRAKKKIESLFQCVGEPGGPDSLLAKCKQAKMSKDWPIKP